MINYTQHIYIHTINFHLFLFISRIFTKEAAFFFLCFAVSCFFPNKLGGVFDAPPACPAAFHCLRFFAFSINNSVHCIISLFFFLL